MFILERIADDVLPQLHRCVHRVCKISLPYEVTGVSFDHAQLAQEERVRFDDGELPAGWVQWWRATAKRIREREGAAVITIQPGLLGLRRVEPLDLADFEAHIGTRIWDIEAGVILAWGVPQSSMNRRHFRRIPCEGAIGVVTDGCCALALHSPDADLPW